jgi:hypothetical protein
LKQSDLTLDMLKHQPQRAKHNSPLAIRNASGQNTLQPTNKDSHHTLRQQVEDLPTKVQIKKKELQSILNTHDQSL